MKARFAPSTIALAVILMASAPVAALAQSSSSFVSQVEVSDNMVFFHTDGSYEAFTMTVSGPDDFMVRQRFTSEEIPRLSVTSSKGSTLADGSYTIEVTAHPRFSEAQRAALDAARAMEDRSQMKAVLAETGIDPEAMKFSTYLGVADGKFLDPKAEEADEAGPEMGAVEGAPAMEKAAPVAGSVKLTGRRWDAAMLPNGQVSYVAASDATAAAARNALQVEGQEDAPPFLTPNPLDAWYEVTFENAADDGTLLAYQGYVRPVASDVHGQLFQAYFREAGSTDIWTRGFFRSEGEGFSFLTTAQATQPAAPLFDYVAQDDPAALPEGAAAAPRRDILHLDDVIIDGSLCVGFDCVNGESFGFDTVRLKENNLRIHFQDTSTSASFPSTDWRIVINDTSNGGGKFWAVEDSDTGRRVFKIEANAPTNALYVDDGGRIGLGTATPVVEVHVVDGDTPTVRLEQDGSSGFTPQTWDLAGNETNFFVRDATNGSQLPFRIRPGADSNTLYLDSDNDVGIGTSSPSAPLHVKRTTGDAIVLVEADAGDATLVVQNDDPAAGTETLMQLNNTNGAQTIFKLFNAAAGTWDFKVTASGFIINKPGGAAQELLLDSNGNMTIPGSITKGSGTFKIDHPLDPENKFLSHSFVESPDMMNVYNGNIALDASGEAVVELPGYFDALNSDFRYQLTPIGAPGPNLFVAEQIEGNRFKIAGGAPGMTVSWQVTGVRKDPYAMQNRIQVEEDKRPEARGFYLHPKAYGQPDSRGIGFAEEEQLQLRDGGDR